MAQKILTTLTDDLDPDLDLEATNTVAFNLDGADYEIDLTDEHAQQLRQAIQPFLTAGRLTSSAGRAVRTSRSAGTADKGAGPDASAVRSWAQENKIPVSPRGRVKGTVIAQFLEATAR